MVMPLRHVNREQVKQLYIKGKSSRDIAKIFDVSYVSILTLVRQMGIVRTSKEAMNLIKDDERFKRSKGIKSKLTKEQENEIVYRYKNESGLTTTKLAKDFGVSQTTICRVLNKGTN